MKLYFLDDGSLIISEIDAQPMCITLAHSEDVEIVRTIGSHYLSNLSAEEAYARLVGGSFSLGKNGLSSDEESVGTRDKEAE